LIISHKLLGTREWFVIHHTNCGMELFTDEVIAELLEDDLATASFDGKTWSNPHHTGGHAAGHFIKWHTIKNQESSVVQDVRRIREHPLVPADVPIYGYIYDVRTGHLNEVKSATEAGKSRAARRRNDTTFETEIGLRHRNRRTGNSNGVYSCQGADSDGSPVHNGLIASRDFRRDAAHSTRDDRVAHASSHHVRRAPPAIP
jgi:hypothetical protein